MWHRIIIIAGAAWLFGQCSLPFDTATSDPDSLLTVSIEFDKNHRLLNSMPVEISWSNITIDNFKSINIYKMNHDQHPNQYPATIIKNGWITVAQITNEFATVFTDTVYDDATYTYRVEFVDQFANFRRAETVVTIQPTTSLTIPDDNTDLKTAVESYLMDSGDTVYIKPGLHETFAFSFFNKSISVIGIGGAKSTGLKWVQRMGDVEPFADSTFVDMSAGYLQGVTIVGSSVNRGGGVWARGNAVIEQCIIRDNFVRRFVGEDLGGWGGGIHASGNIQIRNTIIYNNIATEAGDGIYVDENAQDVQIVNCTLISNNIYSKSSNVLIGNCIIDNSANHSYPVLVIPSGEQNPSVTYSLLGSNPSNFDSTNISGNPLFESPPGNVHLLQNSPGIDSGNPDPQFNDFDGSRNDMGAYGGPEGDW